ncbi:MAG: hypothetical protein AAFV33_16965 [Chloroflexota bacterium]
MLRMIVLMFVGVLCAACAAGENKFVSEVIILQDEPVPAFVRMVDSDVGESMSSHCIQINQREVFESGDSNGTLVQHLQQNTRFFVDGWEFGNVEFHGNQTLNIASDEQGNQTGSYGGPVDFCIDVSVLSVGTHTARIETSSTQDRDFDFEWQFVVSEPPSG